MIHTCKTCSRTFSAKPSSNRRYCSQSCAKTAQRGAGNGRWSGGQTTRNDGRVLVFKPDHPAADARGYVLRYRLVAEAELGRFLLPNEIVHHLNGNRTDDRPENLKVMTQAEHAREHADERRDAATGQFKKGVTA